MAFVAGYTVYKPAGHLSVGRDYVSYFYYLVLPVIYVIYVQFVWLIINFTLCTLLLSVIVEHI